MKRTINVSSLACEFVCSFATAEQAEAFTETVLDRTDAITDGEIAQTAFALGGSVRAVAHVEALLASLPNVTPDAYADTVRTMRAAAPSTLPAPATFEIRSIARDLEKR